MHINYINFPFFLQTREFLNLFRAGREGQGKDFVRQKIRQPKRGRGGRGVWGNSAAPEPEAKPRRLPEALRAETSKNIFFSLIEKNWGWRAKSENAKKMFLLGTRALRAAAGRSGWFRSAILDKMSSSRVVKTHQNLTFGKLTDFFVGGAQRRPNVLRRHFLCARRGEPRLAPAQTEVRLPRDLEILSRICFAQ